MTRTNAHRPPRRRRHNSASIATDASGDALTTEPKQLADRADANGFECRDRRRRYAQRHDRQRIKMLRLTACGHRKDAVMRIDSMHIDSKVAPGALRRTHPSSQSSSQPMPRGRNRHPDRGRRCHAHAKRLRMKRIHDAPEKHLLGPVLRSEQPLATSQVADKACALERCRFRRCTIMRRTRR